MKRGAHGAPWFWRAWVLLVGALGLNCRDATGPRVLSGHLAFAPEFVSSTAGIVDFDRVRITLVRPPSTEVLDTVIAIPPTADSIDLSLSVPLLSSREDMWLFLRLINAAGDTVFRNDPYPQSIAITSGGTGTVVPAPIEYIGVGYDAVAVTIGTADTAVLFGDTLQLSATAWGGQEQPIPGTPIAWISLDSTRVRVPNRAVGKVVGATQRGAARIVAQLLNGPSDTVVVTAQPVPATLLRVSGDGQVAVPLAALPIALRVRVLGNDGLGVSVPVTFRALATGASVSSSVVFSDSLGYAEVLGTLGPGVGDQVFDASAPRIATPITFTARSVSGNVAAVTIDRVIDTIARGTSLQYMATPRDSLGNAVSVTVGWMSTLPSVATIDGNGLAHAVGADSTKIIATAAGRADTAFLYVRALSSIVANPSDTVITAVGDSFDIRATSYDNFGVPLAAGFIRKFLSATPTVVSVDAVSGRARSLGAGNGVVIIRDSVDASLKVQTTATIRVNQVTTAIRNTPALPDTLQVGVGGRRAIIAQARDRNNNPIPNRTFGFRSANTSVATVDAAGIVTGVQLNGTTFVIDSVDGFKDSVFVAVVPAPPALVQWGFDSLAVGNGGNVSVPLTLSRTNGTPVVVQLSSSDSMISRPATGCPGSSVKRVQIAAGASSTSVLICGVSAGRVTIVAKDSAGIFNPDTMIVTVVSTIEFREIGQFSRQQNFYANQNETHTAQVFLSDPAPAGGLGVTFVYGRPGTSAVTPSPAIIPAGQLSANITIQGLAPGRDSVVPTSGGFVGRFSYVDVARDTLQLAIPYPYAIGVGQTMQPYVYFTYAMDHPLLVSLSLTPGIGVVPDTVNVATNTNYRYFTIGATAAGTATVNAAASGWLGTAATVTFTTPQLGANGPGSMVAGDPSKGSWSASTLDSIYRYAHPVVDTVLVTATSRDTNVVAVDAKVGRVRPGQSSVTVSSTLRAQPGAGGDSTWIVLTAPGYRPDSFIVRVTRPALTLNMSFPLQVMVGGSFQNAGYVAIPYVRSDAFTVVFSHSHRTIVSGPDSVTIPPGQTYAYFDIVGDTLGVDTIRVTRATGYTVPTERVFNVVPIHVAMYTNPTTLYTISRPQAVRAYVHQETYPYYANPLVAPLRVSLTSSNPAAFTLDSAGVTIPAGAYISPNDTLRVTPASPGNDSGRVRVSAAGSTNDSSAFIRVFPTPLTLNMPYPQQAGYHLRLQGGYVTIPDVAPDTVLVTLTRRAPTTDSLSHFTLTIPKGLSYSNVNFDVIALDSTGADTVTASATGYVSDSKPFTAVPGQIDVQDIGANHLTTEPPYRVATYLRMRPYPAYAQTTVDTVRFTIVSTDSTVIQIDSAATVSPAAGSGTSVVPQNQYYAYFKIRFVGSGTARVIVAAPGFAVDTLAPITVTGPVLHIVNQNITVGTGQVFQNQYVYVDNPVSDSLIVRLGKSDSTLPPSSQAFLLSADSVIIPKNQMYSTYVHITGQTQGSAQLIARAVGYGQAATPVSVGPPQLDVPTNLTVHVGEVPRSIFAFTRDQAAQTRVVAAPLVVSQNVTDPSVATADSGSRTIGAGQNFTTFLFRGLKAGSVSAVFTAAGYRPDTTVLTVDTGQITFGSVPTTLGPGQTAQMYVALPFTNDSAVVVTLTTSPQGFVSVPLTVTIPARSGSVYFNVSGLANGSASVVGSAAIARTGTSQAIGVAPSRLQLFLSASTVVAQKYTLTVYAEDSAGNARNVTAPLTVSLASSDSPNTVFDSSTITIPAGSYYVSTGVSFQRAGGYTITGSAAAYQSSNVTTTAAGALVLIQPSGPTGVFTPSNVTITAGQYVTWRNTDTQTHTSLEDTGLWNSGNIAPGTSFQRFYNTAGTYQYHCNIHPGMTGTVSVNP